MTSKVLPGRIPAESLGKVTSWMLPLVEDAEKILASAEKEERERREKQLREEQEKIEVVEMDESPPATGISAQELQEIFDSAEKDGFAQGYEAGLQKGTAEGYEIGRQQGLSELRAQMAIEQQRLQQIMQTLLNPLAAQDDDLENMLLDIICSLTQSVVQRELQTDSSHIVSLVRTAVDALPIGSKNIRIYLNPEDITPLEIYAAEHHLEWKFFTDLQLQRGGCRVETPESRVDFSVSTRLQTVLEQFLTGQLASGASDDNKIEQSFAEKPYDDVDVEHSDENNN